MTDAAPDDEDAAGRGPMFEGGAFAGGDDAVSLGVPVDRWIISSLYFEFVVSDVPVRRLFMIVTIESLNAFLMSGSTITGLPSQSLHRASPLTFSVRHAPVARQQNFPHPSHSNSDILGTFIPQLSHVALSASGGTPTRSWLYTL